MYTPPTCVQKLTCVCECRTHTQPVSVVTSTTSGDLSDDVITGLQQEILNQTTHDPIDVALDMIRQVIGLPPPPPPPPLTGTGAWGLG